MNENIFRAYDIRGLADQDLSSVVMEDIGKALGTLFHRNGALTIVLGYDPRPSSLPIKQALVRGLLEVGSTILDVGLVPTPVVYFATRNWNCDLGIVITGSHNSREFNGLKLIKGAEKLEAEEIQALKSLIIRQAFVKGASIGSLKSRDAEEEYINYIGSHIQLPRRIKVVVDAGNGAASKIAPQLLARLGCDTVSLFCEFDGSFPNHFPDPAKATSLQQLQDQVIQTSADLGVAFDGDADRLGAVDDRGNIVSGDFLLALFARDILLRNPGAPIVFNVGTSQVVIDEIKRYGGIPVMWKVGHTNIQSKVKETMALLGGEFNGHFFFAEDYFGYDDAIYSAAQLCQLVAEATQPLHQLLQFPTSYVTLPEMRIKCSDEIKFQIADWMKEQLRGKANVQEIFDIDGIRIHFPEGWALVRATNTEPALSLRFEAISLEHAQMIRQEVLDLLSRRLAKIEEV